MIARPVMYYLIRDLSSSGSTTFPKLSSINRKQFSVITAVWAAGLALLVAVEVALVVALQAQAVSLLQLAELAAFGALSGWTLRKRMSQRKSEPTS